MSQGKIKLEIKISAQTLKKLEDQLSSPEIQKITKSNKINSVEDLVVWYLENMTMLEEHISKFADKFEDAMKVMANHGFDINEIFSKMTSEKKGKDSDSKVEEKQSVIKKS